MPLLYRACMSVLLGNVDDLYSDNIYEKIVTLPQGDDKLETLVPQLVYNVNPSNACSPNLYYNVSSS
jgi:hypothetical protein